MKKEFLEALKLTPEQIEEIQKESGKDIEREKAKFADYDSIKDQLKKASETIAGFGDVEQIKADVQKYKAEADTAKKEADGKIKRMELLAQVKDFTGLKKFVNDITREALSNKMLESLESDSAKGKSMEDIFKALTDGKENILVAENKPTPPVVGQMAGMAADTALADAVRAGAGLPPVKK